MLIQTRRGRRRRFNVGRVLDLNNPPAWISWAPAANPRNMRWVKTQFNVVQVPAPNTPPALRQLRQGSLVRSSRSPTRPSSLERFMLMAMQQGH